MNKNQRQSYLDMIEAAAKAQGEELAWVSNLYQKRLIELEEQVTNYDNWVQSRNKHS